MRSVQKGEGKAGCFFWLAILALVALVSWQVIPVKIDVSDLDDFITRQAETAGSATVQQIENSILSRASDLGLPVTKNNLTVTKGGDRIVISCSYEVPVSLIFYTYKWKVSHKIDRPYFLI
jgi:hypothetical protein